MSAITNGNNNASDDRELVISGILEVPREVVYKAWTDPVHLVNWWGPDGFTNTIEEMDLQAGGVWRTVMRAPDGTDFKNKSIFKEIIEPARIVYDHVSGPKFISTVTFDELNGQTKFTMRMLFDTPEEYNRALQVFGITEGAKQTLQRLKDYVARLC